MATPIVLYTVPGIGHAEPLDLEHLAGWNAIAKDPVVWDMLRMPELSEDFAASLARTFASFADDVQAGAVTKYELVVVDHSRAVVAALTLSCYICSDHDEDDGGVSVDIAVRANQRGRGIASSTLTSLAGWVVDLVPTAHVHADVCTKNGASNRAVGKAGWKPGNTRVPCLINHACEMKAVRFCAHQAH